MGFYERLLLVWFFGYLICIGMLAVKVYELACKKNYKVGKSDIIVIAIISVSSWVLIGIGLMDYIRDKFNNLRK